MSRNNLFNIDLGGGIIVSPPTGWTVSDINDVTLGSVQIGDHLEWNGTNWINLAPSGGSAYSNATPITEGHGGVEVGDTFSSVSYADMFDKILYPYVPPSVSLVSSVSTAMREFGNDIATITLTATPVSGTNAYTFITFKRNGSVLQVDALDNDYVENTLINTNTTFSVDLTDSSGKTGDPGTASIYYSFVHAFYYGTDVPSSGPADAATKAAALTKAVVGAGDKVYGFAPAAGEVYYFAYPFSYGLLTNVYDWNSFPIGSSFTIHTQNITNTFGQTVSYYIYEFNDVSAGHSSLDITFDT